MGQDKAARRSSDRLELKKLAPSRARSKIMQTTTLTPTAERLSTALKVLRLTHEHAGNNGDKKDYLGKCLKVVLAQLFEDGVPQDLLQPLIDLQTELVHNPKEPETRADRERRRGRGPSETLLARASAAIDLLVRGGYEEGEAAQIIMRRLIAAGVPAPVKGGDARGWKRLLEWRAGLLYGFASDEGKAEYEGFTADLEKIPAGERVQRVLDGKMWDRRRKPQG
jgi:hypothetical protein